MTTPPKFLLTIKHLQGICSLQAAINMLKRLSSTIRHVYNERVILFDLEDKSIEERLLEETYFLPCSEGLFKYNGYIEDLVCPDSRCFAKVRTVNMDAAESSSIKNLVKEKGFREGRGKILYLVKWEDRIIVYRPVLMFRRDRFKPRSPERRVYFVSSSLNPPTAMLLVELSLSKDTERLLDPFAGAGGILIEAALRGLYSVGVELDYRHIRGAWRNAKQYGVSTHIDLVLADSTQPPFREGAFEAVATDPPYGRYASTHGESVERVYDALRELVSSVLKRGYKCSFFSPSGLTPSSKEKSSLYKLCNIYVHSGLTRTVWVYYA